MDYSNFIRLLVYCFSFFLVCFCIFIIYSNFVSRIIISMSSCVIYNFFKKYLWSYISLISFILIYSECSCNIYLYPMVKFIHFLNSSHCKGFVKNHQHQFCGTIYHTCLIFFTPSFTKKYQILIFWSLPVYEFLLFISIFILFWLYWYIILSLILYPY